MSTADDGGAPPPNNGKGDQETWAELGIESSAFEALEKDFQEVLQELVGDKSLARFRYEYEKLHRALNKSHANEKRLVAKCRNLNNEIVNNTAKVQTALKLSQEDQHTIAQLKSEIEKSWKIVESAREKEEKAKETINALKAQIAKLTELVEEGAGFNIGQEASVNDLFQVKDELQKEVDRQFQVISQLNADIDNEREKTHKYQAEKTALENQVQVLQDAIRTKTSDFEMQTTMKAKLDSELKSLTSALAQAQVDIGEQKARVERNLVALSEQKQQLDMAKADAEKQKKALVDAEQKEKNMAAELASAYDVCSEYVKLNKDLHAQKLKMDERNAELAREKQLEIKKQNQLQNEKEQLEAVQRDLEEERAKLKDQIKQVENQLREEQKAKRAAQRLTEDVENQMKKLVGEQEKGKKQFDQQLKVVEALNTEKANLEQHIDTYKGSAHDERKKIHDLEKARDGFRTKLRELETRLVQANEEIRIKDQIIDDRKRKHHELKNKNKQLELLYDATRSDRNLYSKKLIIAQDEIAEYKRKFDILEHQIAHLKEEIVVKEQAIFAEHMTHTKVQKEYATKQGQLAVLENQISEARKYQQSQEEEITKLKHIINEADTERMRQKKALDAARNERDILGTQLIRRNDELALLYEKINIQKYTLEKGEKQYQQRVNEIRALKASIRGAQRELKILKSKSEHVESLKMAVYQLQRELLQERNRVKALSEELENPMNIHRWRKLEGTDPHRYELIQKIQTLQKRLITKTEEVVEKELLIQQKEKYYMELKTILARQPGPEVSEQLSVYQQNLKQKTQQLKAMASELNMYQAQVAEFKYENERLARQLNEAKKKFFAMKKAEHAAQEKEREALRADAPILPLVDPKVPRFTGGGFAI